MFKEIEGGIQESRSLWYHGTTEDSIGKFWVLEIFHDMKQQVFVCIFASEFMCFVAC